MDYRQLDRALLATMVQEAAKASFPSGMSRRGGILNVHSKDEAVRFFAGGPFIGRFIALRFRPNGFCAWHKLECERLARRWQAAGHIRRETENQRANNGRIVAAKVLDLLLYRLQVHSSFRSLLRHLYLPLDGKVLKRLRRDERFIRIAGATPARPYAMRMGNYYSVQQSIRRYQRQFWQQLDSRAHLNVLWAIDTL